MQISIFTGKRRFIVSNRVFWAVVVLVAAALLGRNTGQADPDDIRTKRITAQSIRLLDGTGKTSITMYAIPAGAYIDLTANGEKEKLGLFTAPDTGPYIIFTSKGKKGRVVGSGISKVP